MHVLMFLLFFVAGIFAGIAVMIVAIRKVGEEIVGRFFGW
jgi:hypothetical protein